MLEINAGILVAQIITFLLAVGILWKISWKPICALLAQRKETIRKDLELIEETKQAVKKQEAEYSRKLVGIQQQADEVLAGAKLEAGKLRDEILRKAHEEADQIRQKAHNAVQEDNNRLLLEAYNEISEISLELAQRLVSQSITSEVKERLFQETLKELQKVT
ncbi:MAG TPA: F0F1 ATP synthase subunit B [Candidatus Omnitrophota bacterium]|nr:F0F1 ATP synthase subunit B [Candidatus Omnitrophota bacterium]HRZ14140.1 F0F1 ATP synthase subunit B [Candidatus Omnitrophota bacterium]